MDTEAKRWGMLQLANGPSSYSHVINPTGSNFDSQVERLTLLKVYGGDLAADVTAPDLTLPTGTATGATTATGTVTSDEAGTLWYYASTSASESAADIKTFGASQAMTVGLNNVSVTGLTAETGYYLHYVGDDASSNESDVENSTIFTTDAAVSDSAAGYFYEDYHKELRHRRKVYQAIEKKKEKAKAQDNIVVQLSDAERAIETEEARKAELTRLTEIADRHREALSGMSQGKITRIIDEAVERQTFSTMERLEREIAKLREEEEFLMLATQIILDSVA